jgi:pimeloyl-ACP methyl ester carboxylesterase
MFSGRYGKSPISKELDVFSNWGKIKKSDISAPQIVRLPKGQMQDIEIVADLRVPNKPGKFPAVLLLHGQTYLGRKSGLIVLLGQYFQQSGYIVLAPDARGFGDTDEPADIASAESWNPVPDIRRCIDYLYSLPQIDKNAIFIIGHSMGASHALETAIDDDRIRAMVLIGSPRYLNGIQDSFWKRVKFSAVRGLNTPIASNVYLDRIRTWDIGAYANGFLSEAHLPILLVDGEWEGRSNHQYLSQLAKILPSRLNISPY